MKINNTLTNNLTNIPSIDKNKNLAADKAKEACDMFESLYMKQMLQIAYKDIDIMGENVGSDIYKDMYLDELSKQTNGSMGLSKMLFDYLKETKMGGK